MKKITLAILATLLISLSLPVLAQYKITFNNSNLDLPEPPSSENQYALSFDGTNDYVNLPNMGNSDSGTISMWFKKDNTSIEYLADGRTTGDWWLITHYGGYDINFNNSVKWNGLTLNEWTHLAVSVTPTETKLYVNGSLVDSGSSVSFDLRTIRLAVRYSDTAHLNGAINDVRIWNVARTQTEIQNEMNTDLTGNESGLVAYYKMDSGSGSTAVDSAGNNDGTINGATWVENDRP